jgi:hypothetical protein
MTRELRLSASTTGADLLHRARWANFAHVWLFGLLLAAPEAAAQPVEGEPGDTTEAPGEPPAAPEASPEAAAK